MNNETITCLMPVKLNNPGYHNIRWLNQAIQSALDQPELTEIILIDDRSDKNIIEYLNQSIAQNHKLKLLRNNISMGITRSLNKGLEKATSKWITRLDCDDIWPEKKLKTQLNVATNFPEVALYYGSMQLIDQNSVPIEILRRDFNHDEAIKFGYLNGCPIPHGSIFVLTKALKCIGGYQYNIHTWHAEDYATWQQLMRFFLTKGNNDILLHYRVHRSSVSNQYQSIQKSNSAHIKKLYGLLPSADILKNFMRSHASNYDLNIHDAAFDIAARWANFSSIKIHNSQLESAKKIFYDRILIEKKQGYYGIIPI